MFLIVFLSLFVESAEAAAVVSEVLGVVQVQSGAASDWRTVQKGPEGLAPGDKIRTGPGARALLSFDDGSTVQLGSDADFTFEGAGEGGTRLSLRLGKLRAWVIQVISGSRQFQVRTPTAVCSVRGTEFEVQVLAGGRTNVELFKGLLGVEDNRGNQTLLRPNERLSVDLRGMGLPELRPTRSERDRTDFHALAKAEVRLGMNQEQVQAAAAREAKLAEYQQGKILTDVNGYRVRLEQYIVRPSAEKFKFVVLNERQKSFDYFYYQGTFNRALPADLSVALRQLPGCADAACGYFLTEFESGRSNTADRIFERGVNELGGQVDVNSNGSASDDVAFLFDAAQDRFVDVAGRPVFQTLFNKYGLYINDKLKYGWTGNGITSYAETTPSSNADPLSGAALTSSNAWLHAGSLPGRSVSVTFPEAERVHQRVYESYTDGTFLQWDNYVIDDSGKVAGIADFSGITSGAAFRRRLLDYNFEQVISSSHFGGRKIDLVVEPKVLIQAGLIP